MFDIPIIDLPYALPINCILTLPDNTVLKACLHPDTIRLTFKVLPGTNPGEQQIKARLVSPKLAPDSLVQGLKVSCVIKDLSTGNELTGFLAISDVIQSQWMTATKTLGATLEGFFNQSATPQQGNKPNPFE